MSPASLRESLEARVSENVRVRARQKILDATLRMIERDGFRAVNIAAVATSAGVSRQTVYSIFVTREELVSQALTGVALAAGEAIQAQLARFTDPVDVLIELIVAGRSAVKEHPALAALIQPDEQHPLFEEGMVEAATAVVSQMLPAGFPACPQLSDRLDDVMEMVTRLGLSVVFFDSEAVRTDDALRTFGRRWLSPVLTSPDRPNERT